MINGIGRIGYQWGGKSALWDDETMADVFVDKTKEFIAKQKQDKPFFLFFSSQDIHVPRAPHPRFKGKSQLGYRGDAMVQFDWSTGEVLKALEEHGFSENTIVIFSSDNGPVYDDGYVDGTTFKTSTKEVDRGHDGSGLYRGGKYQIYEGGTRVPFIVRWPGKIKAGKSAALVSQIDFIASFAAMLKIDLAASEAIDSQNLLPALLGQDTVGSPHTIEESRGTLALRKGKWKYIQPRPNQKKRKKKKQVNAPALYDLSTDAGEQNNVIAENKEVADSMAQLLKKLKNDKGVREMSAAEKANQ